MSLPSMPARAPAARELAVLEHVQWQPPGADPLWSRPISLTFANERSGLVGRNGSGKSVLCRLLAGVIQPTAGRIQRLAEIAYVPQSIDPRLGSLAAVSGLSATFDALARVESGHADTHDWSIAESNWDLPFRWSQAMEEAGLPALSPLASPRELSGGESERVALACAFLSDAGLLVLDEPTNHLDRNARAWLARKLDDWRGGIVIASHDRELLDRLDRIIELSSGATIYGGNYAFHVEQRASEQNAAAEDAARARAEQARIKREVQARHDDQQRRVARGNRSAKEANIPAIALGRLKDNAQRFDGRDRLRREAATEAADDRLRAARACLQTDTPVALALPESRVPQGKLVLRMTQVRFPLLEPIAPIDLALTGPARVALVGPNGSGKSTLLHAIRHPSSVSQGTLECPVQCALLDQDNASALPPQKTLLEILHTLESPLDESDLRSRLALLGLDADHCNRPTGTLSGGERLKAALACALWGRSPAQLLLLDEPTNHLDLASVEALELALNGFTGALVVVSHDERFLRAIRTDQRWIRSHAALVVDAVG